MVIKSTDLHIESVTVNELGYVEIEFEKFDDELPSPAVYVASRCTTMIEDGDTIIVEL